MNNKSLKPGICKASDGTEISPISSAKTAYVDNGETVYDALKDINITIESTAKIEVLEDFEDTGIDVDTGELNEKLDQTLDKLDDIDYNITNNTNVKLTELEKKIDNINSDIGETFDLEGSNNSGSVNAKLNKVINDNISLQESINTANKNIGSKIDVIGSTTEGTIYGKLNKIISDTDGINSIIGDNSDNNDNSLYGKLNSIISSIKKLSDEDIESIKTLLGNYDDESLNTVFSKLNEILDVSNIVKNTIGITSDTGGTNKLGTISAKLNKLLTDYTTTRASKLDIISDIKSKVDKLYEDSQNITKYYIGKTYIGNLINSISSRHYYPERSIYTLIKNRYIFIVATTDDDTPGADDFYFSCYDLIKNKMLYENKFIERPITLLGSYGLYYINNKLYIITSDYWNYGTRISEIINFTDSESISIQNIIYFNGYYNTDGYTPMGRNYGLCDSYYDNLYGTKSFFYINDSNSLMKYTITDISKEGTLTNLYTFTIPSYPTNIGSYGKFLFATNLYAYIIMSGLVIENNSSSKYPIGIFKIDISTKSVSFHCDVPAYGSVSSLTINNKESKDYVYIITSNGKIILFSKSTHKIVGVVDRGDVDGYIFENFCINYDDVEKKLNMYDINKLEY